jgi:hypothetical protein
LAAGDRITFSIERKGKGPSAVDVELIDHGGAPAPIAANAQCPECDAVGGRHAWNCTLTK